MQRLLRTGIHLGLLLVAVCGPAAARSADPRPANQDFDGSSPARRYQAADKQSTDAGRSEVVAAGYVAPSQWRDQAVDSYEARPGHRVLRAPLFVARAPVVAARVPAHATVHTYQKVTKKGHEIKDWFCYIKGNGPAIWVPADMCRPQGQY